MGQPNDPPFKVGVGSLIPPGKKPEPSKTTFRLGFWLRVGTEGGHKTMPVLGSFDADGKLDVVGNPRLVAFYLFPSDGKGGFKSPTRLTSGYAGGWGGDVGDIDNDGNLDAAFGDHTTGVRVFLGDGTGLFKESSPGSATASGSYSGGALGDVNGDDSLDLIVGADQFANGVRLLAGDGKGGWTAIEATGLPVYASAGGAARGFTNIGNFAFADLDLDGDADLVAFGQLLGSQYRQGGILGQIYRNEGMGRNWIQIGEAEGGEPSGVGNPIQGSVADIDGDRYPDIAAGGTVYLSSKGASFTKAATLDNAQVSHLADMNGDGKLDLVTHHERQGLRIYHGDGTGKGWSQDKNSSLPGADTWPAGAPVKGTTSNAYGIDIGDLDGNGILDIVRVHVARKAGSMWTKATYYEAWVR